MCVFNWGGYLLAILVAPKGTTHIPQQGQSRLSGIASWISWIVTESPGNECTLSDRTGEDCWNSYRRINFTLTKKEKVHGDGETRLFLSPTANTAWKLLGLIQVPCGIKFPHLKCLVPSLLKTKQNKIGKQKFIISYWATEIITGLISMLLFLLFYNE